MLASTKRQLNTGLLTMSKANAKTEKIANVLGIPKAHIAGFSLPAGYTCPGAEKCRSYANRNGGGIVDAPTCEFRCFAANDEAQYKNTRRMVWRNFDRLEAARQAGGTSAMADLIQLSLVNHNKRLKVVRIHVSGDYYHVQYFDAWVEVAKRMPDVTFYSYTKSWHILSARRHELPKNFRVTYSIGGRWDSEAVASGHVNAKVYMTEAAAIADGREVCHDEIPAMKADKNFALVIHGSQPAGSDAGKAVAANRKAARAK